MLVVDPNLPNSKILLFIPICTLGLLYIHPNKGVQGGISPHSLAQGFEGDHPPWLWGLGTSRTPIGVRGWHLQKKFLGCLLAYNLWAYGIGSLWYFPMVFPL